MRVGNNIIHCQVSINKCWMHFTEENSKVLFPNLETAFQTKYSQTFNAANACCTTLGFKLSESEVLNVV